MNVWCQIDNIDGLFLNNFLFLRFYFFYDIDLVLFKRKIVKIVKKIMFWKRGKKYEYKN